MPKKWSDNWKVSTVEVIEVTADTCICVCWVFTLIRSFLPNDIKHHHHHHHQHWLGRLPAVSVHPGSWSYYRDELFTDWLVCVVCIVLTWCVWVMSHEPWERIATVATVGVAVVGLTMLCLYGVIFSLLRVRVRVRNYGSLWCLWCFWECTSLRTINSAQDCWSECAIECLRGRAAGDE